MKTKRSIAAIGIPILLMLAVWEAFRIWQAKGSSDIAVTATVLSEDESGQTERQRIQPKAAAEVLLGNSGQARQAVFDNGILHTGFEHGPVEIKGVIPADSIRNACSQSAVTGDWPFSIVFTIRVPAGCSTSILMSNTILLRVRQKQISISLRIHMPRLLLRIGRGNPVNSLLCRRTGWKYRSHHESIPVRKA